MTKKQKIRIIIAILISTLIFLLYGFFIKKSSSVAYQGFNALFLCLLSSLILIISAIIVAMEKNKDGE